MVSSGTYSADFLMIQDCSYNLQVMDPWTDLCDDGGQCGYDRFTGMKEHESGLLTLLSVGGWEDGSALYSEVIKGGSSFCFFFFWYL